VFGSPSAPPVWSISALSALEASRAIQTKSPQQRIAHKG
jgi:hypothetical protein